MALKIIKSIGTDKGITNEAYVRIADYQISKSGHASFRIQLFLNETEATTSQNGMPGEMGQARNQQIGEYISVQLTKEVEETLTRTVTKPLEAEVTRTRTVTAEDGTETTEEYTTTEMVPTEVEEEYSVKKIVADLSSAEGVDIFAFGYSHLKEKLVSLFTASKVVDC